MNENVDSRGPVNPARTTLRFLPMDFGISMSHAGDGIYGLSVAGELDLMTAPELRARLGEAIDEGARRILLDLSATTFLDSTTLGVLVSTVKRLAPLGGRLAIVCDNRNILTIFEITQLDTVLDILSSEDSAIALLQGLDQNGSSGDPAEHPSTR